MRKERLVQKCNQGKNGRHLDLSIMQRKNVSPLDCKRREMMNKENIISRGLQSSKYGNCCLHICHDKRFSSLTLAVEVWVFLLFHPLLP